jgi:hypothetical protein
MPTRQSARPERDGARHAERNFQQKIIFGRVPDGPPETAFQYYCYTHFMNNDKNIVISLIAILILIVGFLIFSSVRKNDVDNGKISATVTRVIDKPNRAEDGYYGITVKTTNGQEYTINATGYLNTPISPDSQGESCVDVPKVQVGDNVTFNLPRANDQDTTFDTCYKKSLSGYYFKID